MTIDVRRLVSDGSRSDTSRDHPFEKHPRTPTMPPWGCVLHLCPCLIMGCPVSTFLNALTQGILARACACACHMPEAKIIMGCYSQSSC